MRSLIGACSLILVFLAAPAARAQTPAPASSGLRICVDSTGYATALAQTNLALIPQVATFNGQASGTVVVLASIDERGRVVGTSIAQSSSPFLNAAAADAARRSTFAPATHGCDPVPAQVRFPVIFGQSQSTAMSSASSKSNSTTSSSANSAGGPRGSKCAPGPAYLKAGQPPALGDVPLPHPGTAVVHVAVDKSGAVTSATLLSSDVPQAYADAALQMVKTGTFAPKIGDDCAPAADVVDVPIGFHP